MKKIVIDDATKILRLLPNRHPILLIDKLYYYNQIPSIENNYLFAEKKFTQNDQTWQFNIFLVEAMAQLSFCFYSLTYSFHDYSTKAFNPSVAFIGVDQTQFLTNTIPLTSINFSSKVIRFLNPYIIFECCAFTNKLIAKSQLSFIINNASK